MRRAILCLVMLTAFVTLSIVGPFVPAGIAERARVGSVYVTPDEAFGGLGIGADTSGKWVYLANAKDTTRWSEWFQVGMFSDYETFSNEGGKLFRTEDFSLCVLVWKNIGLRGSYQGIDGAGSDWSKWEGDVIFHTKHPATDEFQFYALIGGGFGQDKEDSSGTGGEPKFAQPTANIGAGVMIPFSGQDDLFFTVEGRWQYLAGKHIGSLMIGSRFNIFR